MTGVGREFCGCATYPEGYESGMVVCWKCGQIVSHVDDDGAIATAWMQAERLRLLAERQAVLDCINLYGDEVLHKALDAAGLLGAPAIERMCPNPDCQRPRCGKTADVQP